MRLVVGDLGHQMLVLVGELLPLQGGEPAQLHVEDGAGLLLVDVEQLLQALLRRRRRLTAADQRDHRVDLIDRLQQRADDVRALLGLAQQVPGAPDDHVDLVRHPVPDELVQPERAGHAVDERQHVRAERLLELGVLVQVVQHDLGDRVPLEDDHQPLAGPAAALVPDVGDPADPALAHQFGDLGSQVLRVDLVGELGDHQAGTAAVVLLHLDHGAHDDGAAPGAVGLLDAPVAHDQATGGEVRALDPLEQCGEQFVVGGLGVVQVPLRAGRHLAQVVRRDLGRHADRDPFRAVDQQVGEPGREDHRLAGAPVVVGPEVDGLLVDVPEHLHGQRGKPALGVPVGGRRVVAR